jgi:hypothetical protein
MTTPHIPEELSTRIDWNSFAIMGNTMPPRDPDEEDEDEEDDDEDDDSATNRQSCASRTRTKQDAFSPFTRSGSRDDEHDHGHGGQQIRLPEGRRDDQGRNTKRNIRRPCSSHCARRSAMPRPR